MLTHRAYSADDWRYRPRDV